MSGSVEKAHPIVRHISQEEKTLLERKYFFIYTSSGFSRNKTVSETLTTERLFKQVKLIFSD